MVDERLFRADGSITKILELLDDLFLDLSCVGGKEVVTEDDGRKVRNEMRRRDWKQEVRCTQTQFILSQSKKKATIIVPHHN